MLVDTGIWIDHLRRGDPVLIALLEQMDVAIHPFVIGEVACGHLVDRETLIDSLQALPMVSVVDHAEVMDLVDRCDLMGRGLGWVDMHLLAAASAAGEPLLTRDRRLRAAAEQLGLA